jgi:outer membrane protein assembly factor BamB
MIFLTLPSVPQEPAAARGSGASAGHWPQWRGPLGTGAAPGATPPVHWSETENVRWKVPLPGKGHSTPIIWGDRVYVTAAVATGDPLPAAGQPAPHGAHDNAPVSHRQQFLVLALHRQTGATVWQRVVHEAVPTEGGHVTASFASHSPATDGERIFAFFGSHGVYALDLEGKLLWSRDLGDMHTKHGHGEGSSATLHGDTLVVNWDHEGPSFVVALDKRTGRERWRQSRDEPTSWATPIVVHHGGKDQLIVPGTRRIRAYDLANGAVLWECGGLTDNIVASPVAAEGLVIAGSSYGEQAMLAIRLEGARGDLTGTGNVVWSRHRGTPYVPSPLLYEGWLYFHHHYQGILARVEAATGREQPPPFRLPGIRNVYASPVAADGRVYITSQEGTTVVLRHGDAPEVLAINHLEDRFSASAALADGEMFLRGNRFLYSLAQTPEATP